MEEIYKFTLQDGRVVEVKRDTPLMDIARKFFPDPKRPILGALVDNSIYDLGQMPNRDCNVKFIDLTHPDGTKIYARGLSMLLAKANNELFPDRKLKILHSLSKGLYCRWACPNPMRHGDVKLLEEKMREYIKKDIPFEGKIVRKEEAAKLFEERGNMDKVELINFRKKELMRIYYCEDYLDYYFGRLPASTGLVDKFELQVFPPGLILRFPSHYSPETIPPYEAQPQHFKIYVEYKRWVQILEVSDAGSLNSIIEKGEINDLIRVAEALHEKKIARIADEIERNKDRIKLILIAGPSSSGKTTFAQRLMVQLRVNGLNPIAISLDDYFFDDANTPIDEEGKPDFDHINAIDVPLFNEQLQKLLSGEEVTTPHFDFKNRCRVMEGKKLHLNKKNILLVEGIHGLNPILTDSIHPDNKYRIYVSPLTQLNLDNHNRIPTTDLRIIRRIVRDSKYRNYTALQTIRHWPMVRRGEERFIFPYQEEADVMFNSALIYELAVLKDFVEPLLLEIPRINNEYAEAKRLLSFTGNFLSVGTDAIPFNSILREFIGSTCFS